MAFHLSVYDNFHYSDESDDIVSYATYEEAIEAVKAIVDNFLGSNWKSGIKPAELLYLYDDFSEDPAIVSDDHVKHEHYSARNYAINRVEEVCQTLEKQAMHNTNATEEPKSAPRFLFYNPEEFKKHGDVWKLVIEKSIEDAKAGRWTEEEDIQHVVTDMDDILNLSSDTKNVSDNESKQEKLLLAGFKLINASIKSGVYKFGDIVSEISQMGIPVNDALLIALKRVYGSYLIDHDHPELDDFKTVRSYQLL